jgi:DNA-binding response OmpR family regulator
MDAHQDASDDIKILVVEDEAHLAAGLKLNLELEGFVVDVASSAKEAGQYLLDESDYQVLILDVMLPDMDGFELCRRVRRSGNFVPVIMLTARTSPQDRVQGLEAGADDYIGKPFELSELLARVASCLRRRQWESKSGPKEDPSLLSFGSAQVDFAKREVRVGGELISLTRLEIDLLKYFANHVDRVVSREELLEQVWRLKHLSSSRTVDNFIHRLRRHFEIDPSKPLHFLSVRGSGYRFVL